jgi:hypothetical protein
VLLHMFNDRGKFLQNVAMQTTKRAEFEAQGKALDQRALAVSEWLRLLSFLTMGLRRTLEAHVSWLQGVFNLETALCLNITATSTVLRWRCASR